jgi:membrane protein DedA with SNARE-associated domain
MGIFVQFFSHIQPYIVTYGVIVVFAIVYFEMLGAPLPGETGVITASLLAVHGELSIVNVFAAVLMGTTLGGITGFAIGSFGGRKLLVRYGPSVKLTPERLAAFESRFVTQGAWIVVIARFVPFLRQLNSMIAGAMGMPWKTFLIANVAGALLWTSVWTVGPYIFTDTFRALHHKFTH